MKINNRLQRIISVVVFSAMGSAASGCKPLADVSTTAFILGNSDDIRKIEDHGEAEVPEAVKSAAVLISTALSGGGRKLCSGTLLAPASDDATKSLRVLTNHHCFAKIDEHGSVQADALPEACVGTSVYLGFVSGSTKNSTILKCKTDSLKTDATGDVAVFTIDGNVPSQYGPLNLWSQATIPNARDAIVVHFPDVAQNYISFGTPPVRLPVAAVTADNCQTAGDFPTNEWELDSTLPFSLQHTCDLEHGSSGSALVDRETLAILAVNWGGIKVNYKANSRITNVGTKADYVQAFLDGTAASLRAQRLQNSGDSARLSSSEKASSSKKNRLTAGCGTVGVGNTARSMSQVVILSIIFALPLFYAYLRRH